MPDGWIKAFLASFEEQKRKESSSATFVGSPPWWTCDAASGMRTRRQRRTAIKATNLTILSEQQISSDCSLRDNLTIIVFLLYRLWRYGKKNLENNYTAEWEGLKIDLCWNFSLSMFVRSSCVECLQLTGSIYFSIFGPNLNHPNWNLENNFISCAHQK